MKIKFIKEYRVVDPNIFPQRAYSAGGIMDFISDESAQWLIDNGFAEEVKVTSWWKPKKGELYYFIDDSGYIKSANWQDGPWEIDRYNIGNAFKTKAAADRSRKHLIAIATVRQDNGVLTQEQIRDVFTESSRGVFVVSNNVTSRSCCVMDVRLVCPGDVCFDTKEHAKASLDKHSDEWKIIANYDWSRE